MSIKPIMFREGMEIKNLKATVKKQSQTIELAKSDIKKFMNGDYETLCEFCVYDECCFILDSSNCKKKRRWRGDEEYIREGQTEREET